MTNLDVEWAKDWMRRSSDTLTEHRMELIDLDRAIGDGDHGENMARGFTAVIQRMDEAPPEDVAGVFKLVAQTLMSKVGGAAGPLYGTAFIRASKAAEVTQSTAPPLEGPTSKTVRTTPTTVASPTSWTSPSEPAWSVTGSPGP